MHLVGSYIYEVPNVQCNTAEDSIWWHVQNPTAYVQNIVQDTLKTPNSKCALHGLQIVFWHMAGTPDWCYFVRPKHFSFIVILFFLRVDLSHSQNTTIVALRDLYWLSTRLTEVHNNYPAAPSVHHYEQFSNRPLVISTTVQGRTEGNWTEYARQTSANCPPNGLILPSSSL